jgi:hypothetical protein
LGLPKEFFCPTFALVTDSTTLALTLSDHMKLLRKRVPSASCARTPEQARKAAKAKWKKWRAEKKNAA